jgi:hypothetical protein
MVDEVCNRALNRTHNGTALNQSEEALRKSLHEKDIIRRRDGRGGKRPTA